MWFLARKSRSNFFYLLSLESCLTRSFIPPAFPKCKTRQHIAKRWCHKLYKFVFISKVFTKLQTKSHGFAVTLTALTSISRSYGYWSLSHGKVKSILCPKNCLVFKKQQWLTWLPHKLEKKISLVSPTNGSQDSLIRALKQVFFNFGHFNLLRQSPGFSQISRFFREFFWIL